MRACRCRAGSGSSTARSAPRSSCRPPASRTPSPAQSSRTPPGAAPCASSPPWRAAAVGGFTCTGEYMTSRHMCSKHPRFYIKNECIQQPIVQLLPHHHRHATRTRCLTDSCITNTLERTLPHASSAQWSPEGGPEGVHVGQGASVVLHVQLPGDRQVRRLGEEVLGVVDPPVRRAHNAAHAPRPTVWRINHEMQISTPLDHFRAPSNTARHRLTPRACTPCSSPASMPADSSLHASLPQGRTAACAKQGFDEGT